MYNTVEALRTKLAEVGKEEINDEKLIWFVCIQEAHNISELNLKELASLFQDGIKAIDIEGVQNYLDTIYDTFEEVDVENSTQLPDLLIESRIYEFYGHLEEASKLQDQISELEG